MNSYLIPFWVALTLLSVLSEGINTTKGFYTIVAPASVRPELPFHVSLTLNDFHKTCWFNISLTTFIRNNKILDFGSYSIEPGTTKLIELQAPVVDYSFANIEVNGVRGIISKDSAPVHFQSETYWAFIQTNKFKYRPGDLIQFRLIVIDQLTRPLMHDQNIDIKIYDQDFNNLKTFFDVELVQGVFKGEFQISENPVLGVWRIRVEGDVIYEQKHFEVDRYVLPKFNVEIKVQIVARDHDQIELEIKANYFYGEPVKGRLTLTVRYEANNDNDPLVKQELEIDGTATIILDLKDDLDFQFENKSHAREKLSAYSFSSGSTEFSVEASIVDELSEEKSSTSSNFAVHNDRYFIEIETDENFDADGPVITLEIKVVLRDISGSAVKSIEAPIELEVGCDNVKGANRNLAKFDKFKFEYKNELGKDVAVVNVTNKDYNECYVYAVFQGIKSSTERMYRNDVRTLGMEILTESPEEGKVLDIKIIGAEPIESFSYEILSRGDIIRSEYVLVPGNQTTYILSLNVTSEMVPKITLYVHHIKNMKFGGQLKDVIIKRAMQNSIELALDRNETTPSSSVSINVTTDKGSYVGLMGLDRSALQNVDQDQILDQDFVTHKLRRLNSEHYYPVPLYGITSTIITFSNVLDPEKENGAGGSDEPAGGGTVELVRKLFPESWLYVDFEGTPEGGLSFKETTPDSITTWAITGFSLNPDTGLTFTNDTTDLRVFQRFFVSFDLKSQAKEGEILEVPIYMNNYFLNEEISSELTIKSDSVDLQILEDPEGSSSSKQNISHHVLLEKREKVTLYLKPLKSGKYNVTVKLTSDLANDAVQKTLKVIPRGISHTMTKSYLVHLPEDGTQDGEINVDIPKNAVPGSQRIEVSVVGDIFRPLMGILQKLAKVPYGNGEENMKLMVANSIVLKYLNVLNYTSPNLESKIKLNLELGYQNQLSYKFLDGSFGLFDRKTERTGDVWQTIFTLWGLQMAKEFIFVENNILERGRIYLASKQQENGCYKSNRDVAEDVKLTAFGLMVFLMDEGEDSKHSKTVSKGLAYLNEIWDTLDLTPISVLATYVLILGKHDEALDHLKNLTSRAHLTDNFKQSAKFDTLQSHVETTASSLIKLIEAQKTSDQNLLLIAKGLVVSKEDNESILNHMVALNALITFVGKLLSLKTELNLNFKADDQKKSEELQINAQNAQVLQKLEFGQDTRKITYQSKGQGFAVVDVDFVYSLELKNQTSDTYSTNLSIEYYSNFFHYLTICSEVLKNENQSRFVTIEVNLPSGFMFTETGYNNIENLRDEIKSTQYSGTRDNAVIYYQPDSSNETCVELELRKTYKVFNAEPGWVVVYGEDGRDQRTINSFQIFDSKTF